MYIHKPDKAVKYDVFLDLFNDLIKTKIPMHQMLDNYFNVLTNNSINVLHLHFPR